MHTPPCVLVVDDQPMNVDILCARLASQGYELVTALDGVRALELATTRQPDLILLDVMLPLLDGLTVCRQLKADPALPFIPIILLTVKTERRDVLEGLDAGADDYLTKPVDQVALVSRVQAMLRVKARVDALQEQATAATVQAAAATAWGQALAQQLYGQMAELACVARLKRFVPPSLAELVVSAGSEHCVQPQQREMVVVCCALRGVAALAAQVSPAEVWAVLQEYHAVMGPPIVQGHGTLERFAGTHLRVVFPAMQPGAEAAGHAVRMALRMQERLAPLRLRWGRQQYPVAVGIGIAQGEATQGLLHCAEQLDYAVLGPVTEMAAHLCACAPDGQILVHLPLWEHLADLVDAVPYRLPTQVGGVEEGVAIHVRQAVSPP